MKLFLKGTQFFTVCTYIIFLCFNESLAQDVPFKSKYFKGRKQKFKDALKQLHIADEIIETEKDYDKALNYYKRAYKFNKKSVDLNFKIALCHLKGDRTDPSQAKEFLEKIIELDSLQKLLVYFYLGKTYQFSQSWQDAILQYKKFLTVTGRKNTKAVIEPRYEKLAKKNIAQCNYALQLSNNSTRVLIENLGRRINSPYPEYGPVLFPDMKKMYFTSRRNKTTGFDLDSDYHYYEDIYEATKTDQDWNRVKNIGMPVNTNGHESVLSISKDGRKMLLYRGNNQGDIFISEKKGRKWTTPTALPKPINSKYKEASACFGENTQEIYFSSNRPGTLGGLDIFKTTFTKRKGWTEPENLGEGVNSKYNETAVFITQNGEQLYFSSDSEKSIGGYDVFKASNSEGKWQNAQNLGLSVNTTFDDLYFVTDTSAQFAYYSSKHSDTKGNLDIYKVTFLSPEKPVDLIVTNLKGMLPKPDVTFWLEEIKVEEKQEEREVRFGGVAKTKDGNRIQVMVTLEDALQQVILQSDTLPNNKDFVYTLNTYSPYRLVIQAKGYLPITKQLSLRNDMNEVFILEPLKEGEKLVIDDIYFATGSTALSLDSESSLKQLLSFLEQNRSIKIRLIGHTDNVGQASQNLLLSQQRAKGVLDWLVANGISKNRLKYKGKGDTEPIGNNSTELGRQKNRRTEVEIIEAGN